jgi:class 3 adenylate cyclase/predicted ATPase
MDLGSWLRSVGLEQYEAAFRANAIDDTVLPSLTAEDLKDLGVSIVGHRRKLLDAIAVLRADANAKAAPTDTLPTIDRSPKDTAERRQVTVMFSDLVGSTALSARMDPEDLREVISAYHKCVAETVRRFGGFVAQYLGDGVLVYFGYPEAHEDDAERAVRAGLKLTAAVGGLKTRASLQTRVGIATGLVVVGDLVDAGGSQERGIIGETPNLAARLQGIAEPNMVIIAEGTRRLLGNLFELQDLEPKELKGIAGQVRAWAALRASSVESRFEAMHATGLTALVGREEEAELLLRRWARAKAGEGRVVLVSGEPGIGKSRIAAALHERLESERHTRIRYFCSPHHQDSALYPIIAQLERAADFARDDPAGARLGKLKALLAPVSPSEEELALLAELLSLPDPVLHAAVAGFSPQRKREGTLEALLDQLKALAWHRPVLVVFEDVHWIDPSSRELLDLLVERVRDLPVLLVVTFRPEFQPAWLGRPHVTLLALNRLDQREGLALVRAIAGNAALPIEVANEVFERADGVPLFVEELTKAVLEAAGREEGAAAVLSGAPSPALAVPATLNASLTARLDRLGRSGKEIAQIGAVLGREFSYELIQPVSGWRDAELHTALGRLTDSGLVFCRGTPPHASYQFKHALVQDAAYGTLLRGKRQEFHGRVVAVLEDRFHDILERQPELLAHHLTAAGETERAIEQWLKSGKHAAERSAHFEAIGHFGRGLAVIASLPQTPDRDRQEIELQLARGVSLSTAKGFSSAEAAEAYTRARVLSEKGGDADRLFVSLWGLWNFTRTSNVNAARDLSDKLLVLTEKHDDVGLRLEAHHAAWATHFYRGEPAPSRHHCEEGRSLYDFERHRSHADVYGHDPGVCAGDVGAWTGWLLGYPEEALASANGALILAERLHHPFSLGLSLLHATIFHQLRREPDSALERLRAAEMLAAEQRLALPIDPRILRGAVLAAQGAAAEAVASIREGLAERQTTAAMLYRPYNLGLLAEALECQGFHEGALAALADALATTEKTGERWWEPEIHRLKGVALVSRLSFAESEACFAQSIRIAQQQRAKSLELRAATSLALLWGEQGRRSEACDLLAPVYGWFTEGFDTPDLKEAKVLLDELA